MSNKLCQGPSCHQYDTTDRKRGPKGNKRNITRNVGTYNYGGGNFCTLTCYNDWATEHMDQAIDYIGRLREPKAMTPENSWTKRERYSWERDNGEAEHYYYNVCTQEQREITEQQFNDEGYNLNT